MMTGLQTNRGGGITSVALPKNCSKSQLSCTRGEMRQYVAILSWLSMLMVIQGLTNNFNHPGLEELCVSFYYGSLNALGNKFPDELGSLLPFNVVSLAVAAVSNI